MSRVLRPVLAFVLVILLAACAQDPAQYAEIADSLAAPQSDAVEQAYRENLAGLVARDGIDRLARANGLGPDRSAFDAGRKVWQADLALARHAPAAQPVTVAAGADARRFDGLWRTARSSLYLGPAGPASGSAPFAFSGVQARRVEIRLVPLGDRGVRLTLRCDGPLTVAAGSGTTRHAAGDTISITAEPPSRAAADVLLYPQPGLNRCAARADFAAGARVFEIVREETAKPGLAAFDQRFDVCRTPGRPGQTPLERAFHDPRWLSQTCEFRPGGIDVLTGETAGFEAKVKALLGHGLGARFYREANPEAAIDFSGAPRLSLIYVSYLDIKADFSGRVLDRLLRFHAGRGATIRIMTSDVLLRDKDRAMVEALAADHLNVQLQSFAWKAPAGSRVEDALSELHKVHHVKMLAALSPQPGRSAVIIGGRNIHDGFLFPDPVDLSGFSSLQHYTRRRGLTLNYYSNWRDLDVAIHDDAAVKGMAAHLSTLWHADADTGVFRPFSLGGSKGRAPAGATARHFVSVPYADGRALEAYYVELIDAARQRIEIVNPYLNLTPAIRAAVERALKRGVAITIIGRVDLAGDLGGAILTALNGMFVAEFADRIAIYDYKDPKILLHSKLLMIDGSLVVVSSVNLNNRSFIHDSENGIAVLDRGFYAEMKRVFEDYRDHAARLDGAEPEPLWRLLFKSKILREAL